MMNPVSAMRLLTITLMAGTTAFGQTTLVESGTKAQWKFLDNGSDGGQPDRRRSITGNAAYAHRLRHEDARRSDQTAGELFVS